MKPHKQAAVMGGTPQPDPQAAVLGGQSPAPPPAPRRTRTSLANKLEEPLKWLPGQIKVKAWTDRMGCLHMQPTNKLHEKLVAATNAYDGRGTAFFQDGPAEVAIEMHVPPRYQSDLKRGYTVRFMIDSWTFRHLVGGQSD